MICVDASVAVKWLFDEEHSDEAHALLEAAERASVPLIAPPLLLSEVANAIRQRQRSGELGIVEARNFLARFRALPVTIHWPDDLLDQALTVAHTHDLPAIYDAQYVVLTQMTGADFWTADRRLLRSLGGLPFVHDIADWRPPAEPG